MRIVEWAPITRTDHIPPFGKELELHLSAAKPGGESYAVWNLLYQVLTDNGIALGTVAFTEKGKPFFIGNHVYFSLTHTKGVCAVSVADVPTGIDAERLDRLIPDRVQKRVFSKEEAELYGSNPLLAWCRKEAAAKMRGYGILDVSQVFTIQKEKIEFCENTVETGGVRYLISACYNSGLLNK